MKKTISILWSLAALGCLPSHADEKLNAGDAASMLAVDFCGALVGESPDDIARVAASIAGLTVTKPMPASEIPDFVRKDFKSMLDLAPGAQFHVVLLDTDVVKRGTVIGVHQHDGSQCQVMAFYASGKYLGRLAARLKAPGSSWQAAPDHGEAKLYRSRASSGREVSMMILSSGYTTSMTVYLSRPEPGSATPQAIDEFANEVMPACVRAVLATGKFDPPWFEPRKTAEIMMSSDGPIALRMRQKVPTAVVGLSSRDNQLTCRIISGDPIDAVPAIKSALIRAFLALPGAVDNAGELSLADAATGRKLLLNIEPFGDRVSATIGLAHAEDQKLN